MGCEGSWDLELAATSSDSLGKTINVIIPWRSCSNWLLSFEKAEFFHAKWRTTSLFVLHYLTFPFYLGNHSKGHSCCSQIERL